jgi:hypothetical protein
LEKTNHTSTLSNKTIRPQYSLVAANPSFIHHPNLSISNPALQSTGLTGMFPPSFTHHHHPYRVPSSQPSKTTFTVIRTRDLDTYQTTQHFQRSTDAFSAFTLAFAASQPASERA